jgi:hypothetical protein
MSSPVNSASASFTMFSATSQHTATLSTSVLTDLTERLEDLSRQAKRFDPSLESLGTLRQVLCSTPFLHTIFGNKPLTDLLTTEQALVTPEKMGHLVDLINHLAQGRRPEVYVKKTPEGVFSAGGVQLSVTHSAKVFYTFSPHEVCSTVSQYAPSRSSSEILRLLHSGVHLHEVVHGSLETLGVLFGYGKQGSQLFEEREATGYAFHSSVGKQQYMYRDRLARLNAQLHPIPNQHPLYTDGGLVCYPFSVQFVAPLGPDTDGLVRSYAADDAFFAQAITANQYQTVSLGVLSGWFTRVEGRALLGQLRE